MKASQIIDVPNALKFTVKKSLKSLGRELADFNSLNVRVEKVKCYLVDSLTFIFENNEVTSYFVNNKHVHRFDKFRLDEPFYFSLHSRLHLYLSGKVFNKFELDLVGAVSLQHDTLGLYFLKSGSESSEIFRQYLKKSVTKYLK